MKAFQVVRASSVPLIAGGHNRAENVQDERGGSLEVNESVVYLRELQR